ncbi:DMT family transporter [Candidatus Lokiarchaeum ossiferum]|uniref:DMT family transporter n=1 Tax=Candidatus Lokiarchaeum ossiferum TaxID=2951803 RepID=UPI00352F98D5
MNGVLISILANLSFVISNVLFRKTEHEASPKFINTFRTLLGTITFFIMALIFGIFADIFAIPPILWVILIVSFIFGQVIGDTSYFTAQKHLGATKAMAVSMTFPLFTFLLSMIFLDQEFEIKFVLSLILIGIGVMIIGKYKFMDEIKDSVKEITDEDINGKVEDRSEDDLEFTSDFNQNLQKDSSKHYIAVLFGLIASLGWAIALVMVNYATNEINALLNLGSMSSIAGSAIRFPAVLVILLFMLYKEDKHPLKNKSGESWVWLILAALIGTSLGAYLYMEATRIAGATTMALIASANPLFSLPLTYIFNKEKISSWGFLGVLLTIIGVVLIIY